MADLKISELPAATTPLAGTEVVPIVQGGTTKKVAASDIRFAATPVMCKVVRTTNLAASVWTLVGWDEEVFDDASIHDNVTNNSRLVVPSGYTRARLLFYVIWTNISGGARYLQIRKNAAGVDGGGTSIAVAINSSVNEAGEVLDTGWHSVVEGDHFEAFVVETAAGAALLVGPDAGFGGRSFLQIELANAPGG